LNYHSEGAKLELIRELARIQEEQGCLSADDLRAISKSKNVPLFRLQELVSFYPHFRTEQPPRVTVQVCRDISCQMRGCLSQVQQLKDRLGEMTDVCIEDVSCLGRCDSGPAFAFNDIPVAPTTLENIDQTISWISKPETIPPAEPTSQCRDWKCDPYSETTGHYGTLKSLLQQSPDISKATIEQLKASGLSGLGGAGFPTGLKWELVSRETSETKYVICNADESEPGTFKDRVILEELPHLVIEGMILSGLTIGAQQGIVFIRHEYVKERRALEIALELARQQGVLGENVAGSGRSFDIEIFVSPGGYILGEETALLECLEDKRGEPRNKPPYPGTCGLWGKPTLINNVETFAMATAIIHHGADWWKRQGRGESAGLKFVSVSGDVEQPGVYEISLGTTVNELIELAGGMKDGKLLQAFLPGGASSNFLAADRANTPLDFQAMKEAGSMLGTGAVIVISEDHNLFDLATNVTQFFRNESCGKCVPCRLGSQKAVELLEAVQQGRTECSELNVLPELCETLEQTSICGLGQVALNPIVSLMKNLPDSVPR